VLDTGIDLDHPYLDEENIEGRNWMDPAQPHDLTDAHGHGTHIAGLILEYVTHSKLYVAKVTDGKDTNPQILARVSHRKHFMLQRTCSRAQAIDDAVSQNIDIISISIGFSERVPGYDLLEKAIDRAHAAHILVFAAASNDGGNAGRAFPSRHDNVFCIHSTDAKGDRSSFSPTPERNESNFATVGEAVESNWPRHLCTDESSVMKVKSGTSFATPIAASIAAFLLLYARAYLSPDEAQLMKRHSVIKSVLREISATTGARADRDGYQYLFLNECGDNFFGKGEEYINAHLRDAIKTSG